MKNILTDQNAINEIYFLGAGFSKSLSDSMPLLDELTEEVIKTDIGSRWEEHGNIEDILTFLSHPFPWESTSYSLRKKADFLDLSRVIGDIIIQRQSHKIELSEAHKTFLRSICKNFSPVITLIGKATPKSQKPSLNTRITQVL